MVCRRGMALQAETSSRQLRGDMRHGGLCRGPQLTATLYCRTKDNEWVQLYCSILEPQSAGAYLSP